METGTMVILALTGIALMLIAGTIRRRPVHRSRTRTRPRLRPVQEIQGVPRELDADRAQESLETRSAWMRRAGDGDDTRGVGP